MKSFKLLAAVVLMAFVLPLGAQNPGFETKYKLAQEQYQKGQYETARNTIRKALSNSPGISDEQRTRGQNLVRDCDHAISIRDVLEPTRPTLELPFMEVLDSVSVVAGQPNVLRVVSEDPSVVKIEKVVGTMVYYRSCFNAAREPRSTRIALRMGKKGPVYIQVNQAGRPETRKYVELVTTPSHASVSIDGGTPGSTPFGLSMLAGEHRLHIEKNGYAMKDTTLVIADDNITETLQVQIPLRKNFATVTVNILPEEGFSFGDNTPQLRLNGQTVNLSSREFLSYDDDNLLHRYEVYQDGTIPVSFGQLDVWASAPNFESVRYQCRLTEGQHEDITLTLNALKGTLRVVDAGKARDAVVLIDGEEIGTVGPSSSFTVAIGDHNLEVRKAGHVSEESVYPFTIKEKETTTLSVSMALFDSYVFTSTPEDAQVFINDEHIGNTPTEAWAVRESDLRDGFLNVEVRKNGFWPNRRQIRPVFENSGLVSTEHFTLQRTGRLMVSSDDNDLNLIVKTRRGDKDPDSILVNRVPIAAEVDLPLRAKPYYVELRRAGTDRLAYRGKMRFSNPEKTRHYIQSWSKDNFQLLSANYNLWGVPLQAAGEGFKPFQTTLGVEDYLKDYRHMGDVGLFKIMLFQGLSTSIFHGALLMQQEQGTAYVTNEKGNLVALTQAAGYLPAVTVLFLNDELRIGGAILDYLNVCAVGTYAWYPDVLKKLIGFNHFTGHDIFAGVELSSCLPFINLNVKAGVQMYRGAKVNFFSKELGNAAQDVETGYFPQDLNIPDMFVIKVGFSFGGKDSKGENMIRLF